ncbi:MULTISPECIES: DUF4440 domain-containing protein [Bacillus]|uniref:DUF4440 domain-containing protein n=1 Tax=Bacillus TaxID=1386 RepID=UPI0002D3E38C|nr:MULTISPECIES: DUF4440 domain-containing protein [Bacillus]
MMKEEALLAVQEYRNDLNTCDVIKINAWVSDEFLGYFGYYSDVDFIVYTGEEYREDNIETFSNYVNQEAYWEYYDFTSSLRSQNELINSSKVDFYLKGKKVASVLAMEVFKKEQDGWKLYRQHMERYAE